MSLAQIKEEISVLTRQELDEVTAYLFQLRHRVDADYQQALDSRLDDTDKTHWLSVAEFERRLEAH